MSDTATIVYKWDGSGYELDIPLSEFAGKDADGIEAVIDEWVEEDFKQRVWPWWDEGQIWEVMQLMEALK